MRGIPKYIQTFEKIYPVDSVKEHLIKAYDLGGVDVDKEMLKKNPGSKKKIPFVSVTSVSITQTKSKLNQNKQEIMDYWVYCGNGWYVRKNSDIFEFAKYMTYNTEKKSVEDDWDQEKYG